MPELPEVETIVRDLRPHLTGRILRNPKLFKTDVLRRVSPRRLLATVRNNTVEEVTRRAKHVVLRLATGERIVIQPRMTGNILVYDRRLRRGEERYIVFRAAIGSGQSLVYRDVRRLGTIALLDARAWESYTQAIGPEPLTTDFTAERFRNILRGTRQAIKKALMDQRLLAGVGNIYANEALFRAGIDPSRRADRIGPDDAERLHDAVRGVLAAALAAGGTTFRDYRNVAGDPGAYQHDLLVYGRDGLPCVRCGTRLHTTHAIDNRSTTFCWRCQGRDAPAANRPRAF